MWEESASGRAGFTIVEVILALVLLSFMVMGFQAATGKVIDYATQSDRKTVAVQLVEDRLNLVRLEPDYTYLQSRYEETNTSLPEYPDLYRTTEIVRTYSEQTTGVLDYTTVTVTVDGGQLKEPVARTLVIGAP